MSNKELWAIGAKMGEGSKQSTWEAEDDQKAMLVFASMEFLPTSTSARPDIRKLTLILYISPMIFDFHGARDANGPMLMVGKPASIVPNAVGWMAINEATSLKE